MLTASGLLRAANLAVFELELAADRTLSARQ
jgi:hypothetical protein